VTQKISLPPLAIAFLAGYAVDIVIHLIDYQIVGFARMATGQSRRREAPERVSGSPVDGRDVPGQ
jgi:hypothetical protein